MRKGTPDSFFLLPNGKYVFAEHTTQREGVFEKLHSDIEKCFDEAKTGMIQRLRAQIEVEKKRNFMRD